MLLIPHGPPQSLQDAVSDIFVFRARRDISLPRPAQCPCCTESYSQRSSLRSLLPWNADNSPDRLFIASYHVDADDCNGEPPVASPVLVIGVEYCLVTVIYSADPNHFVTQLLSKHRWLKYDCVQGGETAASGEFDSKCYHGCPHMFVYLRGSLEVPVPQSQTPVSVVLATETARTDATRTLRLTVVVVIRSASGWRLTE